MGKCERCGVELYQRIVCGVYTWFDANGTHTYRACADRLKSQRDEALARAERAEMSLGIREKQIDAYIEAGCALRAELKVALEDCNDGSCHACAKCYDDVSDQLDTLRALTDETDAALRAELARKTEALRWYADPANNGERGWFTVDGVDVPRHRWIDEDEGEVARAALAEPQAGGEPQTSK